MRPFSTLISATAIAATAMVMSASTTAAAQAPSSALVAEAGTAAESGIVMPGSTTVLTLPATPEECAALQAAGGTGCPDSVAMLTVETPTLATPSELANAEAAGAVLPMTQCGSITCPVYIEHAWGDLCNGPILGVGTCAIWKLHLDNTFYFDSVWAWANMWGYNNAHITCSVGHEIGVTLTKDWCGWADNPYTWGHTNAMSAGCNFHLSGSFMGVKFGGDHWIRIDEWANGATRLRGK